MTLVHTEVHTDDTPKETSRNIVLRSIQNEITDSESEITSLSETTQETNTDTNKRLEYITVVLDNLYSMAVEVCSQLVELYIAIGRASEAALIGRSIFFGSTTSNE